MKKLSPTRTVEQWEFDKKMNTRNRRLSGNPDLPMMEKRHLELSPKQRAQNAEERASHQRNLVRVLQGDLEQARRQLAHLTTLIPELEASIAKAIPELQRLEKAIPSTNTVRREDRIQKIRRELKRLERELR
jgi:hypothetical protein